MRNRIRLLFAVIAFLLSPAGFSQISIPANTIVTENFNAIGAPATAALPTGWRMSPLGNTVGAWSAGVSTTTQAASSGTPVTGGRYNWATTAGTDRAVGFLTDGSYNAPNAVMAYYRNTTGSTVNTITLAFSVERYLVNTGSFSLTLASSTDGTTWTAQPAGDIASGLFGSGAAAGTFGTPQSIHKIVSVNVTVPNNGDVYFRWTFTTTNTGSQGLGLDNVSVHTGAPTPVLTAQLRDILQTDNGTQNQFNEGDVIRYQTVIKNIGTADASNVQINIPAPSNTTLVPGSVKTSAVAIDDQYTTSFNTALNGSSVLVNDYGVPTPTAVLTYGPSIHAAQHNAGVAGTTDAGGTITLTAAGTFTYTPPTGFSGIDRFKYITGNGNLPNNDAVVTITVAPDLTFSTTKADPLCNGGANGSITFTASGGSGTLQYSITDAAGTYQASNVFSGLTAGTYNVAVKDASGTIKTGTVTLNNPAAIVVSGDITHQVFNTAMTPVTFSKTGGTGTIVWSVTGLPAGLTINSSTGQVSGAPTVTGSFTATITATDANGCTGSINDAFTVAPKVSDDSYTAVGNTQLVADAHSSPATPFTSNGTNIRTNDQSDAAISITAGTFATTNGGSITIDAAGKFIYTPATGSTTADSYTYTATSNGVAATATINFTVSNMVWYVNNNYSGSNGTSDGRSHRPFTAVNTAATASAASQVIYVHTGVGNTTGAAVLKAGQTLRGAGNALSVGALSIPAGTMPTLTGTVTLANSVTVDGFDMNTGTGTAITNAGASVTGVTMNLGSVTTTTGTGITLTGTGNNVSVTLASLTTNGAVNAVNLANTTGTINITGGTLAGGAGTVVNISGGSASFTYAGSVSQTTASQRLISVQSITGGTVTFSGNLSSTGTSTGLLIQNNTGGTIALNGASKTFSTGANAALTLTSNNGATINFSGGGLAVTTTTGAGFSATGGGTVNITGANNTVGSTTGIAVNIQNTTIGASSITFKSVSANGAPNGIYLANTGSTGSFTVTGDGTNWGSGGTIQNTAGADGATSGNGIYLNNANNVSFNFMYLNGHQNNALYGTAVRGFAISKSRFTGNNGTSNSGTYDESVVHLVNLGGAVSIKNSYFSGGAYNTVRIENIAGTNPVISSLQMETDTLTAMQGSPADVRGTALLVSLMDGSITTGTIQNCRIDSWWGNAIHVLSQGTASATISILNNYCNNTNGALAGAGGIWVAGGTLDYTISGNTVLNTNGTAISADRANFGTLMKGTIASNNIGSSGMANSGSVQGNGIFVSHHGSGTSTTTIQNNTIRQINGSAAISVLMGDDVGFGNAGGGTFNATIQGNNIQESGTTALTARYGILVTCGVTSGPPADNGIGCFNIGGSGALANSITNFNIGTGSGENRIRVNQRFLTTARFPGYTGGINDNTALGVYLLSRNTASNYANANNVSMGGPGFTNTPGGTPCSQ